MRVRRIALLIALLAAPLLGLLLPGGMVEAQTCPTLDFRTSRYGWNESGGSAGWVSGQGFVSGTEYVEIQYAGGFSLTQVQMTAELVTFGTGGTNDGSYDYFKNGSTVFQNIAKRTVPQTFTITWYYPSSPQTGSVLYIRVSAAYTGGTGGLAYIRSLTVCGPTIPAEWQTPSAGGPFPVETPWARATPTPWAVGTVTAADALAVDNSDVAELADTIINSYQFINQTGAVDLVIALVMTLLVLGLLLRLIRRQQRVKV